MTSTVTTRTIETITSSPYLTLSATLGIIAVALLVGLMVIAETRRAAGDDRTPVWVRTLNTAIVPLFLAFVAIVAMRLIELIFVR